MYTYVHPGTIVSDKIYDITLLSFSMLLLRVPLITCVNFGPDYAIGRRKGSTVGKSTIRARKSILPFTVREREREELESEREPSSKSLLSTAIMQV